MFNMLNDLQAPIENEWEIEALIGVDVFGLCWERIHWGHQGWSAGKFKSALVYL